MSSDFVHLHTHSHYSLLEALPKVKDLVAHVKDLGHTAVAVTDNGAMYSAIEFYKTAQKEGIKPIFGLDAYLGREGRHLKRHRIDTRPDRLVLLAETNEGYLNLLKISSIGFLEGFYYKPRVDKEVLREHSKGIIALSGGYLGEIEQHLKNDNEARAIEVIKEYQDIFGKENFYLELVDRPEIAEQETINAQLIRIARAHDVPLVATKNTLYLRPQDVEAWKVLNCIKGGKTLEHFDRVNQFDFDASMVSTEYMKDRFEDVPDAIENTVKIAERCNVELDLGKWNFPVFEIPEGKTFKDVVVERAFAGLEEKLGEVSDVNRERLNYEIDIIEQKGFCSYFLIFSDFLSWAREHDIVTTTRGSAAGSLVGYALNISNVNPMTYEIPFERFLNPERPSAPDIDADIADNRRDEVLDYVRGKYGHEKVAQICTFGKMLARGSVRDVGRALGFEYDYVDGIAKLVPMTAKNLKQGLEESQELRQKFNAEADTRRILDLAQQIEGCARHVSIHAAGTVISPTELTDFTPLQIDTREGKIITQYEMHSVEDAGLIKMDFLGIRNLSILGDAIEIVDKVKGVKVVPEEIPVEDEKTFKLLAAGNTMGVFQLSGEGMTKWLVELKPERIEDIMAMVALYRPGPMESIPDYIYMKENPDKVTYLDPRLEEILHKSHGVLVYQDDVMLIAIKLGGYSWLEADKLRKAMGKKIAEEMARQKIKLHEGFLAGGLSKQKAVQLWKLIEPFAQYGFNKAHACSYGMVAYQTAYMKANYPAEYMTALMTAESGDLEKIAFAVKECERMGIQVLPPDINESLKKFTYVDDNTIRFGLLVIKGLGDEVVQSIIGERKENGPFKDLADFAGRVAHRAFNKKSLDALIKAGALDAFGERKQLIENIDRILMHNKTIQKEKETNQTSLFATMGNAQVNKITLRDIVPATTQELLAWEKELLGLYVSAHPYEEVQKANAKHLTPISSIETIEEGKFVKVGGLMTYCKQILTKKGDPMAFCGIDDIKGQIELIVFPRTFKEYGDIIHEDGIYLISAKVNRREGEPVKLIANSFVKVQEGEEHGTAEMMETGMWIPTDKSELAQRAKEAEDEANFTPPDPRLVIKMRGKPDQEIIGQLRELLQSAPGTRRVAFSIESAGGSRVVETDYTVEASVGLIAEIEGLLGKGSVGG